MSKFLRLALCIVAAAVVPATAGAATTGEMTYRLSAAGPVSTVAETGSDPHELVAEDFVDTVTRRPATVRTTVRLSIDVTNLYVDFACEQSVPVTANQRIDGVGHGQDDTVTISLDTSTASLRTYAFSATPRGTRYAVSSESTRYQPQWRVVSEANETGYRVRMTIPLSVMRIAPGSQTWRLNLTRRIASTDTLLSWAFDPLQAAYCANTSTAPTVYCDAPRWPAVNVSNLRLGTPRPSAEIYALSSAGASRRNFETTPLVFEQRDVRTMGFDAKAPLSATLDAVVALAPDFSNVEQDQTSIAPNEFPRQYAEYRPFFAIGAPYVSALPPVTVGAPPDQLFYSPSLGVVDRGAKLEGTIHNAAVGLLAVDGPGIRDQAVGVTQQTWDGQAKFSFQAVRARHTDGLNDDAAGIAATFTNKRSGLGGTLRYESETGTNLGSARASSRVALAFLDRGNLHTGLLYRDVSPAFGPVDGYTSANDVRGPQAYVSIVGAGRADSFIKSYQLFYAAGRLEDRSGAPRQIDSLPFASLTTRNLTSFSLYVPQSEFRSYAQEFPYYVGGTTDRFSNASLTVRFHDGTPEPTELSFAAGPFAVQCVPDLALQSAACTEATRDTVAAYLHQMGFSTTRRLKRSTTLSVDYSGTHYAPFRGKDDSQWLRRLTLTRPMAGGEVAMSLRSVNGRGGNALPGTNLSFAYQRRFSNDNRLNVEYGSPAASTTLRRVIVKYVVHVGDPDR